MSIDKPAHFFRLISHAILLGGKRDVAWVFVLAVASALVEAIGVGSVMPFIAVATNSGIIDRSAILQAFEAWVGFERNHFIVLLGVLFAIVTVIANISSIASLAALTKFSAKVGHTLSTRLLRGCLAQPYGYFLTASTADRAALILSSTRRVSEGIVSPFIALLAKSVSAICILGALSWIDPFVAFAVVMMIVPIYGLTFYSVRGRLNHLGAEIADKDRESYRLVNEALSGVKDLKILGRTDYVSSRFEDAARALASAQSSGALLGYLPKLVFETVAVLMIVGVILASLVTTREPSTAVSLAALYAYAGYRLLPAIQAIFGSVSVIKYNIDSLESVVGAIEAGDAAAVSVPDAGEAFAPGTMIHSSVELRDITFRYPEKTRPALDSVSIEIPRGTHIAVVGPSGSGKSTLLDVLVGMLSPESGGVYVDGRLMQPSGLPAFRTRIGYVPQSVFLADASVSENIAFGIPSQLIDERLVRVAAQAAQIHEFIETSMPEGYHTRVGERGVRLSGGQRQRLGIARAVYHDPELVILDEATNALDGKTEGAFMETIKALAGSRTIVSVAHRLASVRDCDRIFVLAEGRVVAAGTYESLNATSADFQALVEMGRGSPS
jgi:ATP-binding cassette, subfamily B, bacterial PglK